MKRRIFFLFYVIFFLNACANQKDKDILGYMPYSMSHLYYVSDSIPELNAMVDGTLYDFFENHTELFVTNNTLIGTNNRFELLLIQECKEAVFNEWIQNKVLDVLTFQNWIIYQIDVNEWKEVKPIHISFNNGFMIISSAGYLVEEALLGMEGEIDNLLDVLPEIKLLQKGESYQSIKDFPIIESHEIGEKLHSLLEQKIIGKIRLDDSLYFQGKIIGEDALESSTDTISTTMLSFIPEDVSYVGIYNQKKATTTFFDELSIKSPFNYTTFYLKNELTKDSPFLMIELKEENSEILQILGDKYGVIEDIGDYFLPIIRINLNEICKEMAGLSFVPCVSNPYVFLMDKYLIFAESLNSVGVYLERFLVNESFNKKEFINQFQLIKNESNLKGDLHYFKNSSGEMEAILSLELSGNKENELSFYFIQGKRKKEQPIKKISTYFNENKIKSDVFVLPNKKEGKYIIFQNGLNVLSFMNQNNKLIHSIMLDEEIESEIYHFKDYEIDDDRYIFNTKNEIYILDSKARNLHDFPIRLSSPASNGIGLINIQNTFSTYVFLACENGNFYGYDLTKGLKPMPSWNPLISTGAIQNEMIFLEGKEKTHYAYINKEKELVSLDRKAEHRFKAVFVEEEFATKIQVDNSIKGKERFVLHNGKGKLKIINTKGESFFLPLNNGKKEGDFLLMNMQGSEEKEYIFLSKEMITVHGYTKDGFNKILELDNIYNIDTVFEVGINDNRSFLGGLNQAKNRIYLFQNNGKLMDGFPLEGDKKCNIFPLSNGHHLIVTTFENKLVTYTHSFSVRN